MSLKSIAKTTLAYLDSGEYVGPDGRRVCFRSELASAVGGTRLFAPNELEILLEEEGESATRPTVEVTGGTTQAAAHRLVRSQGIEDLVLLNFASARNPGGGILTGAQAQEEDLARCSGLYPCLLMQPAYYAANRAQESLLYTDHIIFSPSVPWIRTSSTDLLGYLFLASVITAPAPNAGQVLRRDRFTLPKIEASLRRRAGMILAVARYFGHRNLLLGAWGCGVFRNDPVLVADAFGRHLEGARFSGAFKHVTFAVLDRSRTGTTLQAFRNRFSEAG